MNVPDLPYFFTEPLHIFSPLMKVLLYALYGLLAFLLFWLLLYYLYKKYKQKTQFPIIKKNLKYESYFDQLIKLKKERKFKEFVFYASYFLRFYFENKFDVNFSKKTPDEIEKIINNSEFISFLKELEYYKYSKENIDEKTIDWIFKNLERLIQIKLIIKKL